MFDYTNIDFDTFEKIAKCYLESRFPDYKWEATPRSGDGNKDIVCKYKVLSQEFEYWAEAKFSKTRENTLSKGQLDPTLVSALIYPKPVSICFISNNTVTDSYLYRLKDFKLKTNIGIELVLKDSFESWLNQNPNIIKKYSLKKVPLDNIGPLSYPINIYSAIISNRYNNQYKFEKSLKEGKRYYLYLIIKSPDNFNSFKLEINDSFIFLPNSTFLDNWENLNIKQGKHVYKFEISPQVVGKTDLTIWLKEGDITHAQFSVEDIKVIYNTDITLAYSSQEKNLLEIEHFISNMKIYNHVFFVVGDGSRGKTNLLEHLYEELTTDKNIKMVSFMGNEYYDGRIILEILLFFNMGNIFDYDKDIILSQLELLPDEEQKFYLITLVTGYYGLNSKYYKYLVQKSMKHNFCYIYPSHNDMTQVIIIDDLHKLNPELAEVVKEIILQFNKLQNNQMIVIGTREKYNKFSFDALFTSEDYEKKYILNGLSKEDKQNNINYYLGCKKNINFHRATDDLIIFSNILQTNLKETKTVNNIITKETIISRTFQNPQVINSHLYKERLSSVEAYYNLIESVYFIGSGISYKILVKTFPAEDIEFLIDNRFFKRVSDKIFPFHDHYVKAFFEGKEISNGTISFIKQICSLIDDPDEKYMYYALLIKSNYNTYCQIDKEAHELELYYFNKTDYYKSYILSKAIVKYINFDESISMTELYDLFILAVSSGYFEEPYKVKELYEKVIFYGDSIIDSKSTGIILRSQSELINIDYWELDVENELNNINIIINKYNWLQKSEFSDLIAGYLNLLNREMVIKLLFERFDEAQKLYEDNLVEIERLERIEYLGYLYMDYSKGLYIQNLDKSIEYMQNAYDIFEKLNTEFRRFLDCKCELVYLKCLQNPDYNINELEQAADDLYRAQFWEIYSKAKLKLAAIKMVRGNYSVEDIEKDLYIAEYVLDYSFSGRLKLLNIMIKNAFQIFSGNSDNLVKFSTDDKNKLYKIGGKYKEIWEHNKKGVKTTIGFYDEFQGSNIYMLDRRIW